MVLLLHALGSLMHHRLKVHMSVSVLKGHRLKVHMSVSMLPCSIFHLRRHGSICTPLTHKLMQLMEPYSIYTIVEHVNLYLARKWSKFCGNHGAYVE